MKNKLKTLKCLFKTFLIGVATITVIALFAFIIYWLYSNYPVLLLIIPTIISMVPFIFLVGAFVEEILKKIK